jgi:hypothetical protein
MPGSYSHIYLFSIATHHALWFSVAIIAPDSIALTTSTNNINNRPENVFNLTPPVYGIEIILCPPVELSPQAISIPRRLL